MATQKVERIETENESTETDLICIEPNAVALQLQSIVLLREFVKTQLIDGKDFGVIPGCGQKPCLFKAGAEKLNRIFGLGSRIVDSKRLQYEDCIEYVYTVEIFRLKNGQGVAQCEGSTNSLESKYAKQSQHNIANTLRKMAQKRAFVGATLLATAASDFFTQDLEDGNVVPQQAVRRAFSGPTDKQLARLFAIAMASGWTNEGVKTYMKMHFQINSSKELAYDDYENLCKHIEGNPN